VSAPLRPVTQPGRSRRFRWLLLYFCVVLCALPVASPSADEPEVSRRQLDELQRNIAKIDSWLRQANTEKTGLARQLEKQEKKIAALSIDIRRIGLKAEKLLDRLEALKKEHAEHKRSLDQQKDFLIAQLRSAYIQGKQPALKLLLDSDDPQNAARYMRYFDYINDARAEKIAKFQATIDALQRTEKSMLKQQVALRENRLELEQRRTELRSKRLERKKILAKLESSIESESARLGKLRADQQRLEKLLQEVEQAIANIPLPADARPFSQQKTKLPWPSRGKVRESFGSRLAQGKLRSNGIRISVKEDSPVKAVHYGRVVFSDWIRGFGLLLIIDHGEGYMSLYGNNKSLLKETGDWVRAGENIAYSGSSGGNSETGLYFEIRRHGKPQNPTHWLSR